MLLLFITISTNAKAEDFDSQLDKDVKKHRKTERIIGLMRAVGMTHPMFAQGAEYVRENSRNDYLYIAEKKYDNVGRGLNLGLRHEVGTPKIERFEIFLQEESSNYIYTLSSEAVMVRYYKDFDW